MLNQRNVNIRIIIIDKLRTYLPNIYSDVRNILTKLTIIAIIKEIAIRAKLYNNRAIKNAIYNIPAISIIF